ncbi:MAG TPA: hypothetical protein VFS77_12255 [Pyrinomonadaceae bacterium]|nr:hypothetical protein [Pyrinomonadaceae bacterium]
MRTTHGTETSKVFFMCGSGRGKHNQTITPVILITFDPNLLAHGALITTDVGLACFKSQLAVGDVLNEMGQPKQARAYYEKAFQLANPIEPEFQIRSVPNIEQRLESLASKNQ